MDLGRARYRQAPRLPPEKWEAGVLAFAFIAALVAIVWPW